MKEIPVGTGFATRAVAMNDEPVMLVIHETDGTWQFHGAGPSTMEESCIIHPDHIFLREGMIDLMGLPRGCEAERKSVDEPWQWYHILSETRREAFTRYEVLKLNLEWRIKQKEA